MADKIRKGHEGMLAFLTNLATIALKLITLIEWCILRHQAALKRLKDSQVAEEEAYKKAAESQARCEQANIAAFDLCMDIARKDNRDIILRYLNAGTPEKALALLKAVDVPEVNAVLLSSESNEMKAIKLTNIKLKTV